MSKNNNISGYKDTTALLIIFSLFFIPLIFSWRLIDSFYLPKRAALNITACCILCIWLFAFLRTSYKCPVRILAPVNTLPVILFVLWLAVTIMESPNKDISLDAFLFWFFNIVLYFSASYSIDSEKKMCRLLNTAVITAVAVSILGILQYYGFDYKDSFSFTEKQVSGDKYYVFSTLGHPNFMASYLITVFPVSSMLGYSSKGSQRTFYIISSIVIAYCIYISRSKGGWLGFFVSSSIVFVMLNSIISKGERKRKEIVFILCIAFVLISLFSFMDMAFRKKISIAEVKNTLSVNFGANRARLIIWQTTFMMIKDRPVRGFGVGAYNLFYQRYQGRFLNSSKHMDYYLEAYRPGKDAHNDYLQIFTETGVIGISIFLVIIYRFFYFSLKYIKKEKDHKKQKLCIGLLGGIIAVLTHSLVSFPLQQVPPTANMWIFMGLIMGIKLRGDTVRDIGSKCFSFNIGSRFNPYIKQAVKAAAIISLCYVSIIQGGKIYASSLYIDAHRMMIKKDYPKVVEIAQRAIRWYPDNADLRLVLGTAFYNLRRYKDAEREYLLSYEINPDYMILYNLGLIKEETDDTEQAKRYYLESVIMHPDLEDAYERLAKIFKTEGDEKNYMKYYTKWKKYAFKRLRLNRRIYKP